MNFMFPYIGNVIIPTAEVIFFRGVGQPGQPPISDLLQENVDINLIYNIPP